MSRTSSATGGGGGSRQSRVTQTSASKVANPLIHSVMQGPPGLTLSTIIGANILGTGVVGGGGGGNASTANNSKPTYVYAPRWKIFNHIFQNAGSSTVVLDNKADKYCGYLHRHCLQPRLEGYNYCIKHILYDRNAPFKQCTFSLPFSGKRCPNAVQKCGEFQRDRTLCTLHVMKTNLRKIKIEEQRTFNLLNGMSGSKAASAGSVGSIKRKLERLEHFCPSQEHDHKRQDNDWDLDGNTPMVSESLHKRMAESIILAKAQEAIDEDDITNSTLADVLNIDTSEMDNDGPEGFMEDPLRHAKVFTVEEVAHVLRDKLLRLQTQYINMFGYYRLVDI